MPDDTAPISVSDLDSTKLAFLSKWLGKNAIVSGGIAKSLRRKMLKKTKVREYQDTIKAQYVAYVNKKQEADAKHREVTAEFADYWDQMPDLKLRLDRIGADIQTIAGKVQNAAAKDPLFEWGTEQLDFVLLRLNGLALRATCTTPGIDAQLAGMDDQEKLQLQVGKFLTRIADADKTLTGLRNFDDESSLSAALVARPIANDDEAEASRDAAVQALEAVYKTLSDTLTALRAEARTDDLTSDRLTTMGEELTSALSKAGTDRAPQLRALLTLVEEMREAALDGLTGLAVQDPVAGREVARLAKLDTTVQNLDVGMAALDETIAGLMTDLDAASGFADKKRLAGQLNEAREQKARLEQRQAQLTTYKEQTADRLECLETIGTKATDMTQAMTAIRDGDPSPEAAFQAYLETKPEDKRSIGTGGTPTDSDSSERRASILKLLETDRKIYQKSSETVVAEARLFLGDADVTRIDEQQLTTLTTMLDAAKAFVEAGKYGEADMLRRDAISLHLEFAASRNFALPQPPEPARDALAIFDQTFNSVSVLLDQLWGKGGDADNALRTRLTAIKDLREAQSVSPTPDLAEAERLLAALEGDILAAEIPDQDEETQRADTAAKEEAQQKVAQIKQSLLSIHQTEEITDLSEIASLPADHVITVTDQSGAKKFYKIKMKEATDSNKMIDRRGDDYKNVPREDMTRLRQQMQMLEMLAETDMPGSAEMLLEASTEAQALLEQIEDGDAYKAAYDAIKKVEDYLGGSKVADLFATWRPEGYGAEKAAFDRLKDSWEGSRKPADVTALADEFLEKFKTIHEPAAKTLKEDHETATKKLDQIEKDLSADKKGTEANIGAKIAQLAKMDPQDLFRDTSVKLDGKSEDEKQALQDAIATIRGALAYMKTADKQFAGAQGQIRTTLLQLREELETRSRPSVDAVLRKADELSDTLATTLVDLEALLTNKSSNPEAFLLGFAQFLGDAQKGTMEARNDHEFAEEQKRLCKVERQKVKDWLKDNSLKTHRNYTEYTSIAAALDGRYDAIGAELKTSSDYKRAGQDYMDNTKNWRDLYNDVSDSQVRTEAKWFFDFPNWQVKMRSSVGKVATAAGKVKEMLNGKFSDDERKDDEEAKAAVAAVNAILDICQADKSGLLVFDPAVTQRLANLSDPEHELGQLPLAQKKDMVGKLREDALKQLRRIRSRIEDDPAFEVYRNNPLDRGQSWVQLSATLLNMETEILKNLAP